jgi:hypothetical protein
MPTIDNAHALVIGIANYQHINKLPPTVLKDAQDIHDLLVAPQHCGYPPDNVQLLLDGQATQAAISQALADLSARSDGDATVFLYISSHGGRVESGAYAGEYLLPVDVVPNRVNKTAISGDEFTGALRAIPARKVVVVFDCCHSAGIGQPKDATAPVIKAGFSDSYYDALKEGRGRVILASSRSTESSWVLPGAENSLFTQHLLTGMQGGIPSEDGLIRLFDLFEYLQPRVTGDQPNQHPIFKAELEENFAVALYLGGQKGVVPKDGEGFRYDAYVSYERGIKQAKRTVVVLSETYLSDYVADFENVLAQTMGVQEGNYRLLPVEIAPIDASQLPVRLSMLIRLNLIHPRRAEREFDRLVRALQGPLPRR